MRRIFKSFMLVAAAAMAFTSCQKEETAAPETVSATLTMHADVEQTKTYLENNAVLWGKGEAVTLYVGAVETANFFDSASTDAYDGEASALFTFDIKDVAKADSYDLGGIYPASAAMDDNKNAAQYRVILPATQNQVDGNYDPSAYIMVLKPEVVTELPTEYTASFRRAVALNKITLIGVKEDISSVEITVPEKKYLAGRRYMNLTTGESGEIYDSGSQTNVVKVNGDFKAGSFDVWFCSWGVELAAGQELTVKMTSSSKIYTRTIAARTEGIKFVEGDLNKLTVNMASATEEVNTDLSGDYLIASVPESWNLMSGTNGGEYYSRIVSGVTTSATEVKCSDFYSLAGIGNYVWTVEKMGDNYSIKNKTTGKYVSYTGGANEAYTSDDAVEFVLSEKDGVMTVESKAVAGRKLQYNSSSPRFAFYTTNQTPLYFIPWEADTTPRIFVTSEHEQSIGADGGEVKFEYTLTNLPGQSLTVEENSDFVSASVVAGVVTATVSANTTTESRNATLTLKCGEAAPVSVTIIQAGKQAMGGVIKTWSWAGGGKTAFGNDPNVNKTYGLGTDYAAGNAPYLIKLDDTGDYFIVQVDGAIQSVSVDVKMIGGGSTSYLDVQGSADGTTFTSVQKLTISGSQNNELKLATTKSFDSTYRYVKFYFTKGSNVGIGPMSITYMSSESGGETPTPDPEPENPTPDPEEPETPVDPNPGTPATSPCYTMETTTKGTNSDYTKNCDVTINAVTWNVTGNAQMTPWRIGGKSISKADRAVYTKTAYSSALSKVDFQVGTSSGSITWHSLKLIYSTNADFSDAQTMTISTGLDASKTYSFAPEGGFPENCYFKFVMNVTVSGSSNKYYQLSSIKFYGYDN